MSEVVLTNVIPGGEAFRAALAAWVREQGELSAQTFKVGNGREQAGTLGLVADEIDRLDLDDQRLRALYDMHTRAKAPGEGLTSFAATAKQRRLVALLGLTDAAPRPDEFLAELVAVGIADAIEAVVEQYTTRAEQTLAAERAEVEARTAREVLRAQDAESEAYGKLHHAEAEITDLRAKYEHLRARTDAQDSEPKKPAAKKRPKTKVTA